MTKRHVHDWVPNDEGHYDCACGATKGMSVADAQALWGHDAERDAMREMGDERDPEDLP